MVLIMVYNLTFPVESLQLLQPTANVVEVLLPNITSDTQLGTEILFYKTKSTIQSIKTATGSTNIILGLCQEVLTTIYMNTNSIKFVATKWITGAYAWSVISSNVFKSGSITFSPTSGEQFTTVTFPVPFQTAPEAICLTPAYVDTYTKLNNVSVYSISTTSFTFVSFPTNLNTPYLVYWVAI